MNNRIYNDKVDVNNDNIREFYNKRAQKFIKGEKISTHLYYLAIIILNMQRNGMNLKRTMLENILILELIKDS